MVYRGMLVSIICLTPYQTLFAAAQNDADAFAADADVDRVVVFGRAQQQIGTASSASDGLVGYDDFTTRPMLRVGELVEVIPGMVATQHSGSGKANQYFLRGFNLDHGTDFLATIEGMPINLTTHGHGQGYLDMNFIIPEVVETVEYKKGPYHTEVGDFSSAGSTNFNIYDSLEDNFAEVSVGRFGYYRFVSGNSFEVDTGNLLFATEGQLNNGPWVLDDDLKKYNAIAKYSRVGDTRLQVMATVYHSTWNATDQIPARAVTSGLIDEYGFIDGDLGGNTTRLSLSSTFESENLKLNAYGQYYDFNLFSNFTYFANDPVNGDEFEQIDNRSIWGGSAEYHEHFELDNVRLTWLAGAALRYDNIGEVGLYNTANRARLSAIRHDEADVLSLSGYSRLEATFGENLRLTGGMRVDRNSYSVMALRPENSGKGNDAIVSPKFAAAYKLGNQAEVYANYGQGFHSNDVRGAAIKVDPVSGDPVVPVGLFAKSEGAEIGLRVEPNEDVNFTVAGFWLELDSELVFVGDAGNTEVNDGTRRYGLEFSGFWQANDWLAFDVTAATTDAKFNLTQDNYIPGSVGSVFGAGATVTMDNGITGSLRLRHFGSAPLIEDDSVRSEPTTLVNAGIAYEFDRYTIDLDVFNLFGSNARDITYFYESQLAGEAAAVEDIHYHPVEPFTVRLGLRIKY